MPQLSKVAILRKHLASITSATQARLFSKLARKEVAVQIRALRERRNLTQVQFAKLCDMKQSAISRIEQPDYSGWTYKTLERIGEKLRARLRITFEPLEEVIARMKADEHLVSESMMDVDTFRSSARLIQALVLGGERQGQPNLAQLGSQNSLYRLPNLDRVSNRLDNMHEATVLQ